MGYTAFHYACGKRQLDVIRMLLNHGCCSTSPGHTVGSLPSKINSIKYFSVLQGKTCPLTNACRKGDEELVDIFLSKIETEDPANGMKYVRQFVFINCACQLFW
jgi:ankyrin repeat protein